eukprot:m.109027 g.109027  ORF g.109027 m.109027 type:complete len:74 (+) comp12724_c7_seq3:1346-1567(+)
MGAIQSTIPNPPRGYVLENFEVGQRVSFKSPHGFLLQGTIVKKHYNNSNRPHVYEFMQVFIHFKFCFQTYLNI